MATRLPDAARSAAADAVVDRVDAGAAAGQLRIYTGSQPADADDAATGTLLVTFTLADPAFGAASNGVATAGAIATVNAATTGSAGWFRIVDSTGINCMDGAVTVTGGGGELQLNSTSLVSGSPVQITSLTYTQPATT